MTHKKPESVRAHLQRTLAPVLTEQSRLVSDIAGTVLAPVFDGYREQVDQIVRTISAQLLTHAVPTISMPVIEFPALPWNLPIPSGSSELRGHEHDNRKDDDE